MIEYGKVTLSEEEIREFEFLVQKNHLDLYNSLPGFLEKIRESPNQEFDPLTDYDDFTKKEAKLFCVCILYKARKQIVQEKTPPNELVQQNPFIERMAQKAIEIGAIHAVIEIIKRILI